jgi:hypothetical protein
MGHAAGTARQVFDANNTRDQETLRTLYAAIAMTRRPGWPDDGGVDELVASAEMDMVAFPDLRLEPEFSATEGGANMSEVRITGTNTGEIFLSEFGGARQGPRRNVPCYREVHGYHGVIVHETNDDGLIVAERQYWNMLELLAQLVMSLPMSEG